MGRNKDMKKLISIFAMGLVAAPIAARAEYSFTILQPPGALSTQAFGLNDSGSVTGVAFDGAEGFSFMYDMKTGEYTSLGSELSVLEISNSGEMVGDVEGICAISDKDGLTTLFTPPSWTPESLCQARGVNSKGLVSGFVADENFVWTGFIYDPKKGTYEEFLPSPQTIAHGINSKGQNAGSVFLDYDGAYPGSPPGRYGYVREKDGSITYFAISQVFNTRARGISDEGLIAGWFNDPVAGEWKSFVTTLAKGTGYQEITLGEDQVVYQKPCNPQLPAPPSGDYELFTDVAASQIRDDGVIVGSCTDTYFNETTGDGISYGYGFIATPTD
jgi:hypothetical protein